jgi:ADP-heptose:LPS heptosyltransferase
MVEPLGTRIARRTGAVQRAARFAVKNALGKRVRILVELRWRLGDEIMAIPVYEAIKYAYPRSELSVACTYPELLQGNPYVDCIYAAGARVNPGAFDRCIDLRDASRTVPRRKHYCSRANVEELDITPKLYWPHDAPPIDMDAAGPPWVALSTGATWDTKRWPLASWHALADALSRRGFRLVQLGHDDEQLGLTHDLVGRTNVREAGEVLRRCALFIGSDSGLLHLAAACRTPAIGLFGPTSPAILFTHSQDVSPILNQRECQGCWNESLAMREPGVCPLNVDGCLSTIESDVVLAAALERLEHANAACA